jgi:fatty-acyl-CoA synthase
LRLTEPAEDLTLGRFIQIAGVRYGTKEALVFEGRRLTYAELDAAVSRLGRALVAAGVGKGTRVAVLMGSRPEWVIAAYAVGRVGGVLVAVNSFATGRERDYVLRHSDAALLLLQPTIGGRRHLDDLLEQHPELAAEGRDAWAPDLPMLRRVVMLDQSAEHGSVTRWGDFLAAGDVVPDPVFAGIAAAVVPFDDAIIIYTSGTTSEPKAVLHAHRAPVLQSWRWADRTGLTSDDRVWSTQPLFWTAGFAWGMGATLAAGASLVMEETFDAHESLELIERERVTTIIAAPNIESRLASHLRVDPAHDLSSIRRLRPRSPLRAVVPAARPSSFGDMYGATEAFTLVTESDPGTTSSALPSGHGHPVAGMSVRVVDQVTCRPLPPGEVGRIAFRGTCLMRGYYKRPPEAAFDDAGYYITDDFGSLDDEGVLHFQGRRSAVIRTAGANVSALEVELALRAWGALQQASVVGVPHPVLGEAVVACAVRHEERPDVTEADVRSAVGTVLASYKAPRRTVFLDALDFPLTASGKGRADALRAVATSWLRREGGDDEWSRYLEELDRAERS